MYQKFGVVEDYWKATGSDPIDKGRADVTKDPCREPAQRGEDAALFP